MVDINSIIEGNVKFRDKKKWKSRWCVMRKLSPVADCLHLQLYKDSKDRYKNGQTKASLSLQHFLGIESGFTLDKESNTIAIICQDVIVVLAFDTRERLMQWQVKISNNLGDDIQYLILVSSAPPKTKIATGPARMHIQDHKFCLTTGVPPKLAGLWVISHLRRYGVVDNRFCFEGGSSCGKGEGLYVLITDLGEEITQTFKLATQGNLSTKKRPLVKKNSIQIKPPEARARDETLSISSKVNPCFDTITSNWPSEESRQVVSNYNYGCGDTISVLDGSDNNDEVDTSTTGRSKVPNIERCLSCISKLGVTSGGATSLSQCSNTTQTPPGDQNPVWNLYIERKHNQSHNQLTSLDLMSMCSRESSNNSEYSIPRHNCSTKTLSESVYGKVLQPQLSSDHHHLDSISHNPPTQQLPPQTSCTTCQYNVNKFPKIEVRKHIGPYENYDKPKNTASNLAIDTLPHLKHPHHSTPPPPHLHHHPQREHHHQHHHHPVNAFENYDTPKKLQEYLGSDVSDNNFGNYDKPAAITINKMAGESKSENAGTPNEGKMNGRSAIDCTCNKVMSWADNWISLPYCKRGNSIENTSLPLHQMQVKSNDHIEKIANEEGPVYATIDMNKKSNKKAESLTISHTKSQGSSSSTALPNAHANYVNLYFEKSLNNYENSRKFLTKINNTEAVPASSNEALNDCENVIKNTIECVPKDDSDIDYNKNDNYMIMEPRKIPPTLYIPMAPVNCNYNSKSSSTLPSRISGIPKCKIDHPFGFTPTTESEHKKRCVSVDGEIEKIHTSGGDEMSKKMPIVQHFINEKCITSLSPISSSYSHSHSHLISDNKIIFNKMLMNQTETEDEISESTNASHVSSSYIRRSESVPCKSQNRDSSSSNDSGVSTGSLRQRGTDFYDFELPLTTAMSGRCFQKHMALHTPSFHTSLPRRSKSFDPLREITFLFPKAQVHDKSSSNNADTAILMQNPKNSIPNRIALSRPLYIDSRSTSSGTSSDMSDYIETLSLSSHSSSETQDSLRQLRQATTTLRPRSGREYNNIDRLLHFDKNHPNVNSLASNPAAAEVAPVVAASHTGSTTAIAITPIVEQTEVREVGANESLIQNT